MNGAYPHISNPSDAGAANYPQISGLAPGQHSASILQQMFGPPTNTKSRAYGQDISSTHQDLYHLYEGENLYLRDTILGLTLRGSEAYTFILPWLKTNQMHFKWNTFEFNYAMAGPTPAEGISRILSSQQHSEEASTTRNGIAFIMEGDTIGTPEGEVIFRRNLQQMTQAVLELVYYHTMHAIVSCKQMMLDANKNRHMVHPGPLEASEELEAAQFGVLLHNRQQFSAMVEEARTRIRDLGGEADTLLVFPRFTYYSDINTNSAAYTEYYQPTVRGLVVLRQGPVAPSSFRGLPVFESRDFNAAGRGDRYQPLAKLASVGEYYPVTADLLRKQKMSAAYQTSDRSVAIYDWKSDNYKPIDFKAMFLHSRIFGGNANDADGDGLNPAILAEAAELNAMFKLPSGYDDERRVYGNPEALESTTVLGGPRKMYLMLAHNSDTESVAPAKYIGELDLDVIPSDDLKQTAQSMQYRIIENACFDVCEGVRKVGELVERLEAAPYSEAFAKAIANENADLSVDRNGNFIGVPRQSEYEAIDWQPNGFGGLSLPRRNGGPWPVEGFGLASYPMIATLAQQGEARGYKEPGDTLIADARAAVATIKEIYSRISAIMPSSEAIADAAAPEWIHALKGEAAVFNWLHTSRPPIFLGISNEIKAASRERPVQRRATYDNNVVVWQNGRSGKSVIDTRLASEADRLSAIIASLTANEGELREQDVANRIATKVSGASQNDVENAALFNKLVKAGRSKTGPSEDIKAAAAVAVIAQGLSGDAATEKFKEIIKELSGRSAQEQAESAATGKKINNIFKYGYRTLVNVPQPAVAQQRAGAAGDEDVDDIPLPRRGVQRQDALRGGPSGLASGPGGSQARNLGSDGDDNDELEGSTVFEGASAALDTPLKGEITYLSALASSRATIEEEAKALEAFAGAPYEFGKADAFIKAAAANNAPEDQIASFKDVHEGYMTLVQMADAAIAKANPRQFDMAGNEIVVEGAVPVGNVTAYYRSPLAMSPQVLRTLAVSSEATPAILPADPSTSYRSAIKPQAGDSLSFSVEKIGALLRHPSMGALVGGRLEHGSKDIEEEPLTRKFATAKGPWQDEYAGWRRNKGGLNFADHVKFGLRERGDGTVALEEQMDMSMKLERMKQERAAAGIPDRPFGFDLAEAEQRRNQLEMANRIKQMSANAAANLSMLQSGNNVNQSNNLAGRMTYSDPFARAQRLSYETDEATTRHREALKGKYAPSLGAWGNSTSVSSGQYLYNRHNEELPDPQYWAHAGGDEEASFISRGANMLDKDNEEYQSRKHPNMVYRYNKVAKMKLDPLTQICMYVLLYTPNRGSSWISLLDNNIHFPMNFLLWRPYIKFEMFMAVVMQSGLQTGANVLGQSSMNFDNSAADKMMLGHYTFHHKSVVFNHRRVEILANVYPRRYLGGWDTEFITSASALLAGRDGGSLIVTPIAITENIREVSLDLLDTSQPRQNPSLFNRPRMAQERAGYSSASFTQRIWGIREGDIAAQSVQITADGRVTGELINQRVRRGKHYKFNPNSRKYDGLDEGCSALSGDRTGPGVRAGWSGTMRTQLDSQRNVMMHVSIS
jgi:hypothetical protein